MRYLLGNFPTCNSLSDVQAAHCRQALQWLTVCCHPVASTYWQHYKCYIRPLAHDFDFTMLKVHRNFCSTGSSSVPWENESSLPLVYPMWMYWKMKAAYHWCMPCECIGKWKQLTIGVSHVNVLGVRVGKLEPQPGFHHDLFPGSASGSYMFLHVPHQDLTRPHTFCCCTYPQHTTRFEIKTQVQKSTLTSNPFFCVEN
jgi:hypothetical protein